MSEETKTKIKRPKIKEKVVSSYFTIYTSQYDWIRKEAFDSRQSMSALVREALDLLKGSREKPNGTYI